MPDIAPDDRWQFFVDACQFAYVYDIYAFENRILDAFYHALTKEPYISVETMATIYNDTADTPLLREVLASWVLQFYGSGYQDMTWVYQHRVHNDLAWDVLKLSYMQKKAVGYLNSAPNVDVDKHVQDMKEGFCATYHNHDGE